MPNYFKKIGWFVFVPSMIYLILVFQFDSLDINFRFISVFPVDRVLGNPSPWFSLVDTTVQLTIIPILILVGSLFIIFSKEKNEDEYIASIREKSLVWGVKVYMAIFIIATLVLYGFDYFYFMFINTYILFILIIAKFYFEKHKIRKEARDEK